MKKKFDDLLNEGYEYPEYIDEVTAELISDWFRCRYVLTENFYIFFNRSLALNYPYYVELLRVDPVTSKFDWFVEEYLEKETTDKTTNEGENTRVSEGTVNATVTKEGTDTKLKTGSTSVQMKGTETDTKGGTDTDSTSSSNVIDMSKTYRGSETETEGGSDRRSKTGTDTTDTDSSNENVKSGSIDNMFYGSETHNTSRDNVEQHNSRVNLFSRNTPMSAEYQSAGNPISGSIVNIAGTLSLNDDNINRPKILNPSYTEDGLTQNVTGGSEKNTDTLTYNNRSNRNEFNNVTDESTVSENVSRETSETDNITYGKTNTKAYTNRADDVDSTETLSKTDTKTYNSNNVKSFTNRSNDTVYNTTDTSTKDDTETTERTDNSSITDSSSNVIDRLFREIHTGRHENVATIIEKSRHCIVNSESWLWLYHQLDKCFLQVYDI